MQHSSHKKVVRDNNRTRGNKMVRKRQEEANAETSSQEFDTAKSVSLSALHDERNNVESTIAKHHRRKERISGCARGYRGTRFTTPKTTSYRSFYDISSTALLMILLFAARSSASAVDIVSNEIEGTGTLRTMQFNRPSLNLRSTTHSSSDDNEQTDADNEQSSSSSFDELDPSLFLENEPLAEESKQITDATHRKQMGQIIEASPIFSNEDNADYRIKVYPLDSGLRSQAAAQPKLSPKEVAAHLRKLRRLEVVIQFEICTEEGVDIVRDSSNTNGALQKILQSADTLLTNFMHKSARLRRLEDVYIRNSGERGGALRAGAVVNQGSGQSRDDYEEDSAARGRLSTSGSVFYTDFVPPVINEVIKLSSVLTKYQKIKSAGGNVVNGTTAEEVLPECDPYLIQATSAIYVDFDYNKETRAAIQQDVIKDFQELLPDLILSD